MLRASSQTSGEEVDVSVVMTGKDDGGVACGAELARLAQAVVTGDAQELAAARTGVVAGLGVQAMIDAVGVASNFQRMVRIADSTGITLGRFEAPTGGLRDDLGINKFAERPG